MDAGSTHRLARIALIATAAFGFARAGVAQEIPEGQSCGGLVCDLGLFGHKVVPKPAPAPSGSVDVAPVPIPPRTIATTEPGAEARRPVRKRAHVARAVGTKATGVKGVEAQDVGIKASARAAAPDPAAASIALPDLPTSVQSPAAAPSSPIAAALAPPPSFAAPAPAAVPVTATPARDEPVVLANPYVYDKPLKFMFQSVDPTQSVQ